MNNNDLTFKIKKTEIHGKVAYAIYLLYKNVRIDDRLTYDEKEVEQLQEKLKKQYFGKISKSIVIDNGLYSTLIFQRTFQRQDLEGNVSLAEELQTIKFYNYNGESYVLHGETWNSLMVRDINEKYENEVEKAKKEHLDYLPLEWVFPIDVIHPDIVAHMLENSQVQSIFNVIKKGIASKEGYSIKEIIRRRNATFRFYISPEFTLMYTEKENELEIGYYHDHWLQKTGIIVKFDADIDNLDEDQIAERILDAIISNGKMMNNLFNYMWRLHNSRGYIEDIYPHLKDVPLYNVGEEKKKIK